jgi:hypothetical protein
VSWPRAGLALTVVAAVGLIVVSGGEETDPRTPPALPGLPPPFLGTAVAGSGELTAAVDAYGNVVDLRAPGPAGQALIDNPADRQAAGTVPADTGIVPRLGVGGGPALPLWEADSVEQRYVAGTNVVRTVARLGPVRLAVTVGAAGRELAVVVRVRGIGGAGAEGTGGGGDESAVGVPSVGVDVDDGIRCRRERQPDQLDLLCRVGRADPVADGAVVGNGLGGEASVVAGAARVIRSAAEADRRWLARSRSLGTGAPGWAVGMYERSLLVLRALTDRRSGAVAAGARDGWAYVWPRDAGTAALALAAAGYTAEAERVARFLLSIDEGEAARFHGDGTPVPGRAAQGDAVGWIAVAAEAGGLPGSARDARVRSPTALWRDRADYWEGEPGNYLANAIASSPPTSPRFGYPEHSGQEGAGSFATARGLVRREGEPESGLDSAAAWAVEPFGIAALYPQARQTLRRLTAERSRFGITPGEGWEGVDPWSAPTAWSAWSLAALGGSSSDATSPRLARADRWAALALLGALRRSATPAGALPERVDVRSGIPRSTTPLVWSHAFAVLALRELWPSE